MTVPTVTVVEQPSLHGRGVVGYSVLVDGRRAAEFRVDVLGDDAKWDVSRYAVRLRHRLRERAETAS